MTGPFVSSYDTVFMEAFDRGIKEMPQDLSVLVKVTLDKFHEDVVSKLENYILDDMKSNLDAAIRNHASCVASSMLANALAGDNTTIRTLFGFNEWYMKHLYTGRQPTQWDLIDAIVVRRPDLFVDERIAQRDAEIHTLNQQVVGLSERLKYMSENYVEMSHTRD